MCQMHTLLIMLGCCLFFNNQKFIVNSILYRWEINIAQQNSEFDSFWGYKLKKQQHETKNTLLDTSQNITFQALVSQCAWGINMTGDTQLRNHTKSIKTFTVCLHSISPFSKSRNAISARTAHWWHCPAELAGWLSSFDIHIHGHPQSCKF